MISAPEDQVATKRGAVTRRTVLSFAGFAGIVTAVVLWPSAFGSDTRLPSLHFMTYEVRDSVRFTTYEIGDCVDFGGKKMVCPDLNDPTQLRVTKIFSLTEAMDEPQASLYAVTNCPYKVTRFNWPSADTYAIGDRQFVCIGPTP